MFQYLSFLSLKSQVLSLKSQHNIRYHHIQHQNNKTRHDDGLRAGLAKFERAAFDAVAVEGGHGGHDEGEDAGFGEGIDHVIDAEAVGEAVVEVVKGDAAGEPDRQVAAEKGEGDTEDTEYGVHNDRGQYFRQY